MRGDAVRSQNQIAGLISRGFCFGWAIELGFDGFEFIEDFEDRRLGVREIADFDIAMKQMKAQRGGVEAVARGVG